jgi:hypothetical protein
MEVKLPVESFLLEQRELHSINGLENSGRDGAMLLLKQIAVQMNLLSDLRLILS